MVSAIVLAAGLSKRMGGENKLLLPFNGKTVVGTVVKNIIDSRIKEVIVVTGRDVEKVGILFKHLPVILINNDDYEKGLTTSIQKGVSIARGEGYMICLGDMPFLTAGEYLALATFFEEQNQLNSSSICIAEHNKKAGNPVIFSSYYKNEILSHANPEGCKAILLANKQHVYSFEMNSENIFKDIDTPGDYKEATL